MVTLWGNYEGISQCIVSMLARLRLMQKGYWQ
ncbi:hypothetical protein HCW86_14830 [Escherichia coli]|nr:hypothetical protein [Escherichia coli]